MIYSFFYLEKKPEYKNIPNNHEFKDGILREHAIENLTFKNAHGHSKEQIYFYDIYKNYYLTLINVKKYRNVNLSNLHLYKTKSFNSIHINPQRYFEREGYELIIRMDTLKAKDLSIYTNAGCNVIAHDESENHAFLNILSNGFLIAGSTKNNHEAYHIQAKSKRKIEYFLYFAKTESDMQIIILTPKKEDYKLEKSVIDSTFKLQKF